ncbi:hypothetical protein KIPB_002938 [Kipferlia bialata]|uniref:Uncharacterized protein n=1 Tax=Kipferlia bialata TaxID=797122 RepID=A0A9K3GH22_9EUKA|nr:hypothetical protein KIPB_002938 [Kipferlia bialata]|eukprot:g2938.t1
MGPSGPVDPGCCLLGLLTHLLEPSLALFKPDDSETSPFSTVSYLLASLWRFYDTRGIEVELPLGSGELAVTFQPYLSALVVYPLPSLDAEGEGERERETEAEGAEPVSVSMSPIEEAVRLPQPRSTPEGPCARVECVSRECTCVPPPPPSEERERERERERVAVPMRVLSFTDTPEAYTPCATYTPTETEAVVCNGEGEGAEVASLEEEEADDEEGSVVTVVELTESESEECESEGEEETGSECESSYALESAIGTEGSHHEYMEPSEGIGREEHLGILAIERTGSQSQWLKRQRGPEPIVFVNRDAPGHRLPFIDRIRLLSEEHPLLATAVASACEAFFLDEYLDGVSNFWMWPLQSFITLGFTGIPTVLLSWAFVQMYRGTINMRSYASVHTASVIVGILIILCTVGVCGFDMYETALYQSGDMDVSSFVYEIMLEGHWSHYVTSAYVIVFSAGVVFMAMVTGILMVMHKRSPASVASSPTKSTPKTKTARDANMAVIQWIELGYAITIVISLTMERLPDFLVRSPFLPP